MPKKKTIINPKQGERLKLLLKQSRLSQRDLSEEISAQSYRTLSQQRISDIICGRAPLTYEVADCISSLKRYDGKDLLKSWLLCEENFQSTDEKIRNERIAERYEGDLLTTGLSCFLNLSGYQVTTVESLKGNKFELTSFRIEKEDNSISLELSPSEMFVIGNRILHLCETYFQDHLK